MLSGVLMVSLLCLLMFCRYITTSRCKAFSAHSSLSLFKIPSSGSKSWMCTLVLHEGSSFLQIVITLQSSAPQASLSAPDGRDLTLFLSSNINHRKYTHMHTWSTYNRKPRARAPENTSDTNISMKEQMACKKNAMGEWRI